MRIYMTAITDTTVIKVVVIVEYEMNGSNNEPYKF